jgi:hypothetical protein
MIRKLTFTLISSILLALMVSLAGAQDAAPRVWLVSEVDQMTAGQEFAVSINIQGGVQLYGGSFEIAYDPTTMEVIPGENNVAVTPGSYFGAGPSFTLSNLADAGLGAITYALTLTQPAEPVSGDGQIGILRFRALAAGPVLLEMTENSLVSPEFTQVDGRLVAQSINSIDAQPAAMVVGPVAVGEVAAAPSVDQAAQPPAVDVAQNVAPVAPVVEAAPAVVEAAPATSGASASVAAALANTAAPSAEARPMTSILLIAGALFIFGMALLTISVGLYTRMRAQFSLKTERLPEYVS